MGGFFGCSIVIFYLFSTCGMADMTTANLLRIAQDAYGVKFYNAPIEHQKYIQMMIMNGQKERYYTGGGMIIYDLQKFGDVSAYPNPLRKFIQPLGFKLLFI